MAIRRIKHIEPVSPLKLRATFDDGRIVLYDVAEDVRDIPDYAPLETVPGLFGQVQLDQSRTCVFWNDDIDLPSDAVYEYGERIAPAHDDAK